MKNKTYRIIYDRVRRKYSNYTKKQCGIIATKIFKFIYENSKSGGSNIKYCKVCGCIMDDDHDGDICECCLDDMKGEDPP